MTNIILLWHFFCHNKHVLVMTKHIVSCDKSMLVATQHLLQKTNIDKHNFTVTKVLSRQAYFCHNKRRVLLWQTCVCRDKQEFVLTKLLSRQKWYLWQLPPMILIAQGALQCKHQQHTLTHVQTNLQTQLRERRVKKSYWTGESGGWFWKRKRSKVVECLVLEANCFKRIEWGNRFTAVLWLI